VADTPPTTAPRASLLRSLFFYSALLAVDILAIIYVLSVGVAGAGYLTLAVIAVVGALLAYQVWTHLLDAGASVVETEGVVERKWQRADLIIVWHSYYITVGRRVFKIAPEDYIMVDEEMPVKVVHFPHTLNVVSVRDARKRPPLPSR
jgi:hypothetical protein